MLVWTRLPVLPLAALAIWSRDWISWWCLLPLAAIIAWAWINPRAFPPRVSTRSWASRAVMGDRVLMARAEMPIPDHHGAWAAGLSVAAGLGILPLAWGLWAISLPWVLLGLVLSVGAKRWLLDRMVWLFDEMSARTSRYGDWLR